MDSRPTVLVIEDDPVQSAVCMRILLAAGFAATAREEAGGLVEALDAFAPPSAVLMDIGLPGLDGLEALREFQQHREWCQVPAVVMTASPDADRVMTARNLPVPPEAFLAKPFSSQDLIRVIRCVLVAREPLQQLRRLQRQGLNLNIVLRELEAEFARPSADSGGPVRLRQQILARRKAMLETEKRIDAISSVLRPPRPDRKAA